MAPQFRVFQSALPVLIVEERRGEAGGSEQMACGGSTIAYNSTIG
jgi:hypothetical protein